MNEHRTPAKCPFGGKDAYVVSGPDRETLVSAAVLGKVTFSGSAMKTLWESPPDRCRPVQRWLVDQQLLGSLPAVVTTHHLERHWNYRQWSLKERADRLFRFLARSLERKPLTTIDLDEQHQPQLTMALAHSGSRDQQDLVLLLQILVERGWIDLPGRGDAKSDGEFRGRACVTPAGWLALEEPAISSTSDVAFVAMWFSPETDAVKEAIFKAVADAGWRPRTIGDKEYIGPIMDEILGEIRAARFVIADYTCGSVTGADTTEHFQVRGGVYLEAGFAMGLGIPVISTVRSDLVDAARRAVHFDVAQYNHIVWSDPADLEDRLKKRIAAVIGWGPHLPAGAA